MIEKRSTSTRYRLPIVHALGLKNRVLRFSPSWRRLLSAILLLLPLIPQAIGVARPLANPEIVQNQAVNSPISILVDDFKPQPLDGDDIYFYNRLGGDRGTLKDTIMEWGDGQVKATISSGDAWGGFYESLNHPNRENVPVNFSAILSEEILPTYQSQISGLTIKIVDGTQGITFKVELKEKVGNNEVIRWQNQIILSGGEQVLNWPLPSLGKIHLIVFVLENVQTNDYVVVDQVSFTATTQITDTATAAYVWSYGMLLNNWNPTTGLVRDKAKDGSGEFDSIQATGSLATATAFAEQLGIISRNDAIGIVTKISQTLLNDVPRFHEDYGLWPHWVKSTDGTLEIVGPDGYVDSTGIECEPGQCTDHNGDALNDDTKEPCNPDICTDIGTEWSTVDTVIAAIGLLDAQSALGLDTSGTEQMINTIDWENLLIYNPMDSSTIIGISHGYDFANELIHNVDGVFTAWDTFGGESWLVELAYAAATGQVTPLAYASPPTANGSGFIDELAWILVLPPSALDIWDTDWNDYRANATENQISYYPNIYPNSCFSQLELFGLSAAELPNPSLVKKKRIYQDFGIGGQHDTSPNDGSEILGLPDDGSVTLDIPVVVPHYSGMIASLRPEESLKMWGWLISNGYFSPLNNIESLMFDPVDSNCDSETVFNQLKGSWNLSLQALGWGRYLAQKRGKIPSPWQATIQNSFLSEGYFILVPPTFQSVGAQDGHLFELSENSNTGWRFNTNSVRFYIGDDHRNRQYLSILSFDTSSLPDDAVILSATLNVKHARTIGTNPFDTHGNLWVEIGSSCFGSSCNLENPDFQAGAQDVAGILSSFSVDNWHSAALGANVYPYINLAGVTQFRLRFELDDNNDSGMDAIQFLSGDAPPDERPQLVIEYTAP